VTQPAAAGSTGTLNMNSIPISKIILDGKPLGSTPKMGVSVSAGVHTVTFVMPDGQRKSMSVAMKGGETKTAVTRFLPAP
jgi:serine/threonine-protein kinase